MLFAVKQAIANRRRREALVKQAAEVSRLTDALKTLRDNYEADNRKHRSQITALQALYRRARTAHLRAMFDDPTPETVAHTRGETEQRLTVAMLTLPELKKETSRGIAAGESGQGEGQEDL